MPAKKLVFILFAVIVGMIVMGHYPETHATTGISVVSTGSRLGVAGCDSNLQSTSSNDLIVLELAVNGTAYTVSNLVDTAGGTWILRATSSGSTNVQVLEYYLIVPAGISHWRFGCNLSNSATEIEAWVDITGENIQSPFDVGSTFPVIAGGASGTATWAFTTKNTNDILLGLGSGCNNVIQLTSNGFTGFGPGGQATSNCATSLFGDGGYLSVSSLQTLTPTLANTQNWATISDAVKAPPSITTVTPSSGPIGTNVTIAGSNFQGATTVTFQSSGITFHLTNDTTLTAIIGSGNGPGDIRIDNSAPIATDQFDLIAGLPPPSGGGGCCGPPLFITPPITNKTQIQPAYALAFPDVSSIPFLQLYVLISLPLLGGYAVAYAYGYRFDPYRLRWVRHPKQFKPKTAKIRFT